MPLWRIYAHSSTFTTEQKRGLATAITKLYTSPPVSLPAFYVNVLFIPLEENDVWVGGETRTGFVRIVVEQIARTFPTDAEQRKQRTTWWLDRINEALKPYIADRPELTWESHISETPRDLWRVNGIEPPPSHSKEEKMWTERNEPVPWQANL